MHLLFRINFATKSCSEAEQQKKARESFKKLSAATEAVESAAAKCTARCQKLLEA